MKKLSRFEKVGLIAAVVVAGTFFYMKRMYEPQEKVLKNTVQQLNKVIGEVNVLKAVPPVGSVKKQLEKRKAELAVLENRLKETTVLTGADREVTELLSWIVDLIADKGFVINAIVPKGKMADSLFQWNLFEVDLDGNFYRFIALLTALRDKSDAVRIEKITLTQKDGQGLHIRLNLMI
jgi:Tfp pilus assembly protein PilO